MPQASTFLIMVALSLVGAVLGAWIWAILRLAFRMPILPASTPRVVPWGPFSVLLALLLWVASQMVAPAAYRMAVARPPAMAPAEAASGAPKRPASTPGELMTFSAIANALTILCVPLVLAATAGATRLDFGVRLAGLGRQVGRGLIAYPLLAPIVFGTLLICVLIWRDVDRHPLQEAIKNDRSGGMAAILVLAGVVLAPAAEELIFRGVLLGWLTRIALGTRRGAPAVAEAETAPIGDEPPEIRADLIDPEPDAEVTFLDPDTPGANPYAAPRSPIGAATWPVAEGEAAGDVPADRARGGRLLAANAIVSLIFAALHGAVWPTPIPIFFLSLGLGLLYQRTGSILGPIALHVAFNGVSTLFMFLTVGMNDAPPRAPSPVPPPASIRASGDELGCSSRFW